MDSISTRGERIDMIQFINKMKIHQTSWNYTFTVLIDYQIELK